jgi:hypothetical protein
VAASIPFAGLAKLRRGEGAGSRFRESLFEHGRLAQHAGPIIEHAVAGPLARMALHLIFEGR